MPTPQIPSRTLNRSIALLTASRMVLNMATRMVYPFLPMFAAGLQVDLKALSSILIVRSSTGFLSPFLASLADLWGHKRGVLVGIGACLLANLAVVLFPTYWVFFAAMGVIYLGMYFFMSSMQAYVGDQVPFQRRGMALAVTETGWALSFVVGMPLFAFLIRRWGWLSPFWLLVVLTATSLVFLWRWLPREQRDANNVPARSNTGGFFRNLGVVLASRPARFALLMSLCLVAANEMVNLVFGVWIHDRFGLSVEGLGATALAIGLVELVGELTGGVSADRIGKGRSVAIGALLNIVSAAWMGFFSRSLAGALFGLSLFYLSFEFAIVAAFSLVSEVMPEARATMMGANVSMLSLGRMVSALLVPYLYALDFSWNLVIAAAVNVLAIVFMGLASRTRGVPVAAENTAESS
ncbi:MAG: MFS transporter [Anaerolineae bacterium]|nr:MFS transporter [Anaerolineae bacterium]